MRPPILFLVLLLAAPVIAEEKKSLRLLSYNIHAGIGTDGVFDLERIAKVITEVKPDIVALQEVDQKTKRSSGLDIAAELAKLTEMTSIFGASIPFQGGHYGNAILTSLPVASTQTLPLPEKTPVEKRSLLSATLLFHEQPIRILATHFCHREEANRIAAVETITTLDPKPVSPSFLLGDLNALPDSVPLQLLKKAGWQNASKTPHFTVPVESPTRQIDYVLFRDTKGLPINIKEVRVLYEKVASDHRPILAVLEW